QTSCGSLTPNTASGHFPVLQASDTEAAALHLLVLQVCGTRRASDSEESALHLLARRLAGLTPAVTGLHYIQRIPLVHVELAHPRYLFWVSRSLTPAGCLTRKRQHYIFSPGSLLA